MGTLFHRPISEHFAAFPADQASLDEIRQFVQSGLLETPLGRKSVAGLLIAVEEAVTNIIRHGYLFGPGRIQLRLRRTRRRITITVTDQGRPYTIDPGVEIDPHDLAESGRRGGLGMLLMRKVTDGIDCRRQGDTNTLTMVKDIPSPRALLRPRPGMGRKIAWAGVAVVTAVCVLGGMIAYAVTSHDLTRGFTDRWTEFGRTVAASASQHLLNDRSDAEFDQLVTDVRGGHPDLLYVQIVDSQGRIRADSEHPDRVHTSFVPPPSVPNGQSGNWPTRIGTQPVFHFAQVISMDRRTVGNVVFGVAQSTLEKPLAEERRRIIIAAAVAGLLGVLLIIAVASSTSRPIRKLGEMLSRAQTQGVGLPAAGAAPDDMAQVLTAINEITAAVANSERQLARRDLAQRELKQAQQLQRALLPLRLPTIPGYDAGATYQMARHVGGDYYDVIPAGDNTHSWAVIVADVAGKGFPAALVMTAVRTAVRLIAPQCSSPTEILGRLDQYLREHHPDGPFVTAICGILDTETNRITLASAGHTPVLHRSMTGRTVRQIKPAGRPIGVGATGTSDAIRLESQPISLEPGDVLVLYTDGLSEARNSVGESMGIEGLGTTLLHLPEGAADQTVNRLMHAVGDFTKDVAPDDDITVLVLLRTPEESPRDRPVQHGRHTLEEPIPMEVVGTG